MALLTGPDALTAEEICSTGRLLAVLEVLLKRAAAARVLRPAVTKRDLLMLTNAIAVATEPDAKAARRLLRLALQGIWVVG